MRKLKSKSIERTCYRREGMPCESRGAHAANSALRSAHMRTDVLASCGCVRYAGPDVVDGQRPCWAKRLVEATAQAAAETATQPRVPIGGTPSADVPAARLPASAQPQVGLLPQPPPRHGRRTDARVVVRLRP